MGTLADPIPTGDDIEITSQEAPVGGEDVVEDAEDSEEMETEDGETETSGEQLEEAENGGSPSRSSSPDSLRPVLLQLNHVDGRRWRYFCPCGKRSWFS